MKVKIIVPCFNESLRIKPQEYIDFIQTNPNIDFLFIDDGSQDNTLQILESIQAPRLEVIHSKLNIGKAEAIRLGFKAINQNRYQFTGYIDGDHSLPLTNLNLMYEYLKKNPATAYLSGERENLENDYKKRSLFRYILKKIFSFSVQFFFQLKIKDPQSACKMIATTHINKICEDRFLTRWLVDLEIYFRLPHDSLIDEIKVYDWKYQYGSKNLKA